MGVRAEVEKSGDGDGVGKGDGEKEGDERGDNGDDDWIEVGIEMGRQVGRDEEAGVVFLGEMLREGLVGDGGLRGRLVINRRWHWRLFVDVSGFSSSFSLSFHTVKNKDSISISTSKPSLNTFLVLNAFHLPRSSSR